MIGTILPLSFSTSILEEPEELLVKVIGARPSPVTGTDNYLLRILGTQETLFVSGWVVTDKLAGYSTGNWSVQLEVGELSTARALTKLRTTATEAFEAFKKQTHGFTRDSAPLD